MFTLKITTTASTPSESRPITWLSDVTMVTLITRGGREFMDSKTTPGSVSGLTGTGPGPYWPALNLAEDAGQSAVLSLLYVVSRSDNKEQTQYVVAELAWLLGSDGQTIERIAP